MCFSPLLCVKHDSSSESTDFEVITRLELFSNKNNSIERDFYSRNYDHVSMSEFGHYDSFKPIEVPCGKCLSCRLAKSSEWATRLMLESTQYKNNYFLTLTYDDSHLSDPRLDNSDFQLFMKRLRINFQRKVGFNGQLRVFYAGEYGSKNLRKHFHAIMLNCPIPDLVSWKTKNGLLYTSDFISNAWHDQGFISVAPLTFQTAGYTARYTMKKAIKDINYDKLGLTPEFHHMSNRPGIGYDYFMSHKERLFFDNAVYVRSRETVLPKPIPKAFERYCTDGEDYMALKNCRELNKRIAEAHLRDQLNQTNLTLDDLRKFNAESLQLRCEKKLIRDL